jgi:Ni/Fe-hydrogenase 1 B-type cytochrome subunit
MSDAAAPVPGSASPPLRWGRLRRAPGNYRWVYLWHLPIRISHWVAAGTIVVLAITGYYIGHPFAATGGEASAHFMMGWMRFFHFTAAGLLVAVGILRVYGLFLGNRYERWTALFPVKPSDWKNTWKMAKAYVTARPETAPHYLGHNPLQQVSYTAVYGIGVLEIATGFALYGLSNPAGFIHHATGWMGPLFGGWQMVRLVHHAILWIFASFVPLHVYLVLRSDVGDREGTLSSIFSGGRFVRDDVTYEDE